LCLAASVISDLSFYIFKFFKIRSGAAAIGREKRTAIGNYTMKMMSDMLIIVRSEPGHGAG
jgi:hypothetical protein